MTSSRQQRNRQNGVAAIAIVSVVVAMVGLTFASPVLYKLFCESTGFGGTTRTASADSAANIVVQNVAIRVRFDGNVQGSLPWTFAPIKNELEVTVGKKAVAYYRVTNTGSKSIVGRATFNVMPAKAGPYFDTVNDARSTRQVLGPGESVNMPVHFYVDPAILKNRNTKELREITLSYTFFRASDQSGAEKSTGGTVDAQPKQHMKVENSGQDRAAAARRG